MKDEIFSFQLKKKPTFAKRLLDLKCTPPLYLTRILNLYHKRNDGRKFPEK